MRRAAMASYAVALRLIHGNSMSKNLADALNGQAWSVSAILFDLTDLLDEEGRPISERRADAAVRSGVQMDMRECPYAGIRQGQWMNMSALVQVTTHYNAVMAEIAAFRRQSGGTARNWSDILAAVLDQLARPTLHLLQQRDTRSPVPGRVAVGHKLAAGYFGVMRTLHERLALGAELRVSTQALLDLVDETGALVGPAEVCAGSPQMIRNASTILVEGGDSKDVELAPSRLAMARCLALQVQLGIVWQFYDHGHLWELIHGATREQLVPGNLSMARKLERAVAEVASAAPPRPLAERLPAALDGALRARLGNALRDAADPQLLEEDRLAAERLLAEPGSAIRYAGAAAPFALRVAHYLAVRRLFVDTLSQLERELRTQLGYPLDTPVRLGTTVFPLPQALPWYELVLGRRVGDEGHLTGSSFGLRMPVKAAGAAAA